MVKKILKYVAVFIAAILLVLIVTNPSVKQFKEYIGERDWQYFDVTYKRTNNYFIFSTYSFSYSKRNNVNGGFSREYHLTQNELIVASGNYTGVLYNFYR